MFLLSKIIGLFWILILISEKQSKDLPKIITKTYYKTYKMECDLNPEYVDNLTCQLKAMSFTRAIVNFKCDLKIPLRNVSFNAALYKMYSEFRPFLFNFTMNACDFVDGKSILYYPKMVYKVLKPFSNINHSCPYEGTIFAEGLEFKDTNLPVGFWSPLGKFKTTLTFTEGYPPKDLGSVNVYCEVFEKRIRIV